MTSGAAPPPNDFDLDPEALARAEAALARLADRYLDWAEADLARLEATLAALLAEPGLQAEHMAQLFLVAHDMKGQAATFGYPLVSELGNRLCRLIETRQSPTQSGWDDVAALVAAIGEVIRRRLAGDGGIDGQRLLQR